LAINDQDTDTMLAILARYNVQDQVSVLNSLLYSVIVTHAENNLDVADKVFHQIHTVMPHHWSVTLGTLRMHDMPVDPRHAN
jgi:hypothetical protein